MNDHDHSYKRLFSHRRMVEDLLRGFVKEDWVQHLDFATLEKVNANFVSDDHRDREDDVIWKVRWGEQWVYVYLLIEFQSTVVWHMAVRIMVYVGLLYQDLIDSDQVKAGERLPPVLPIVLYNGKPRWTAAEEVGDLIQTLPGGLERYRPSLRYLLLDEGRYSKAELGPMKNLSAAIFRLENSRSRDDAQRVVEALLEWLDDPNQAGLQRDIANWIQRVLLRRRLPDAQIPEVTDLREVHNMLAENVDEWFREREEQGLRRGLQQGRREGRKQGEEAALILILEQRFGPLTEGQLTRIRSVEADTLLDWIRQSLTVGSVDELLHPDGESR